MDIVLKNADFSESGILAPYQIQLTEGKQYSPQDGSVMNTTTRCCDLNPINIGLNKVTNNSNTAYSVFILFYSTKDTSSYIGCASYDGTHTYTTFAANASYDVTKFSHYIDGSGNPVSIANAKYWRITVGVASASGVDIVAETDD